MPAALHTPIVTARTRRPAPATDLPLTVAQKRLIRLSFLRLEPALDLVAQLYFMKLFRLDPALRRRFSGPVEIQQRKFMAALKLTMISLGHEDGLRPTLMLLGTRHRQIGIRTRHYRTMARALIWTLEQSLETRFDRDTKDAWNALLSHVTRTMAP